MQSIGLLEFCVFNVHHSRFSNVFLRLLVGGIGSSKEVLPSDEIRTLILGVGRSRL